MKFLPNFMELPTRGTIGDPQLLDLIIGHANLLAGSTSHKELSEFVEMLSAILLFNELLNEAVKEPE